MTTRASFWPQAALSLSLSVVVPAFAQEAVPTLADTVVTANRTPTRVDSLVSDVTVIDRADIEKMPGQTLTEILVRLGGVQMATNGGRGKSGNIFIRGAESRHTILLIDGVRYGSATTGTPVWSGLPLEAIERIEVLKGPGSSLYGSDGVGGVVQIFTRRGSEGFHPSAFVGVGSEHFATAGVGLRGGDGQVSYAIDASTLNDHGFSTTNPTVQFGNYNADRDPLRQRSLNASLGVAFARDWQLDLGVLHSEGTNHYDDGAGRDTRDAFSSDVVRAGVNGKVLRGWKTQVQVSQSIDDSNTIVGSTLPSFFKTTQDQFLWQNDVDTPLGVALLGVERLAQRVDSATAYTVTQRSVNSVFAGLNGEAGAHSWQFNLRNDRNSQFGNSTTGFAGYGYRFAPAWRAHVSYGTSFVAPSFNQLYYPGFGNATLVPEEGRNTDVGLTWSQGGQTAKLVYFENRIRGFIPSGPLPANVPRARIDGWTLSYDASIGNWLVRASLDSLDPRNLVTQKQLARRSNTQASLGVDHTRGAWTVGGTLLHVGDRYDDTANTFLLERYTTLDLNVQYAIAKAWTLQAQLRNVTDEAYETVRGYNQPGRGVFVTLRWAPK
ncbi:MAG: TonB-dependent receptor [Hydrogenophaga sp.]|uniref:TonB-dependent receptor domain-containing protein n=1 Tax=Hydrogenophaga sp. TaxID=1904254 RepID=UPI001DA12073|nr:TonB-dependent receptor [Hydrogenophaga sp.]MBX3609799.1 TonB-dependent receptor [Hydrogenophaga sp.]